MSCGRRDPALSSGRRRPGPRITCFTPGVLGRRTERLVDPGRRAEASKRGPGSGSEAAEGEGAGAPDTHRCGREGRCAAASLSPARLEGGVWG